MSSSEYGFSDSEIQCSAEYNPDWRRRQQKSKEATSQDRKSEEPAIDPSKKPLGRPRFPAPRPGPKVLNQNGALNTNINATNPIPLVVNKPTTPPSVAGNVLLSSSLKDPEAFKAALMQQAAHIRDNRAVQPSIAKPIVQVPPGGGNGDGGGGSQAEKERVWWHSIQTQMQQKDQGNQSESEEEEKEETMIPPKKRRRSEPPPPGSNSLLHSSLPPFSPQQPHLQPHFHSIPAALPPVSGIRQQQQQHQQRLNPYLLPAQQQQQQQHGLPITNRSQLQTSGSLPNPLPNPPPSTTPPFPTGSMHFQQQMSPLWHQQQQRSPLPSPRSLPLPCQLKDGREFPNVLQKPAVVPPPLPLQAQSSTEELLAKIDKLLRAASEEAVLHHQWEVARNAVTRDLQSVRSALTGMVAGVASGLATSPRYSKPPVNVQQKHPISPGLGPKSPVATRGSEGVEGGGVKSSHTPVPAVEDTQSVEGNIVDAAKAVLDFLHST